jgi:hypothetical protein
MARSQIHYTLFRRRPTSATIGLSIAAISFLATILQGLIQLIASRNFFFFDFMYGTDSTELGMPWKQAIIGITWAAIGLIACYLALAPRNAARFTVIATAGVKLFAFLTFSDYVSVPVWRYVMTIVVAALPMILLLTRQSNAFYNDNI